MAHTIDSLSIAGLRKAHLRQLAWYIRERDRDGWYVKPKDQFEARHKDLLEFADMCDNIANDNSARIKAKRKS